MVHAATLPPLVWFHPRVDRGGSWRSDAAPARPAYQVISGLAMDSAKVGRLMKAAADAVQPGSRGMRAVSGAAAGDDEWTLVRIAVHEAAHAVVAERWGYSSKITIGRGDQFGTGLCDVAGLALATEQVKRQIGLAGILADLQAEHGGTLTITQTLEAVRRGPMSEGDLQLMAGWASPRDVDTCQRRVELQWDDVISLARQHVATELRYYQVRLA